MSYLVLPQVVAAAALATALLTVTATNATQSMFEATPRLSPNLASLIEQARVSAQDGEWHSCVLIDKSNARANPQALRSLWRANQFQDIFLIDDMVFSCPCTGGARLAGAAEQARIGGAAEQARLGGAAEQARLGGAAEQARVGGAADQARVGGAAEQARVGGAAEQARVGGGADQARVGGAAEQARVGGAAEQARVGGAADQARLGGDAETLACIIAPNDALGYQLRSPLPFPLSFFDGSAVQDWQ